MRAVLQIQRLEKSYSMEKLYKVIGKTRQAYIQHRKRNESTARIEQRVINLVKQTRESHPRMDSRVMYHTLMELGYWVPYGVTKFE